MVHSQPLKVSEDYLILTFCVDCPLAAALPHTRGCNLKFAFSCQPIFMGLSPCSTCCKLPSQALIAVCSVSQGTCCVQWGDVGMKTVRGFPHTADISRGIPSKASRCCGMHTCRAWLKKIIIRRWRWHVNVKRSCSCCDTEYLGLLGQHGNWYMGWLPLGGLRKWKRCL